MNETGNDFIEESARILKVLGDRTRMSILMTLKYKESSVGSLAEKLNMEQSALSHQLKILKDVNLVRSRTKGKRRIYSLTDHHVHEIIQQLILHLQEPEE